MKIAMVSFAEDLPRVGGGGTHVSELSAALVRLVHEVTVFGYADDEHRWLDEAALRVPALVDAAHAGDAEELAPQLSARPRTKCESSAGYRWVQVLVPRNDLLSLAQATASEGKCEEVLDWLRLGVWGYWVGVLVSEGEYDVWHGHHWRAMFSTAPVVATRCPSVYTPHLLGRTVRDWQVHGFEQLQTIVGAMSANEEEYFARLWTEADEFKRNRGAIWSARSVIALSTAEYGLLRRYCRRFGPTRAFTTVHFVPNGVNLGVFSPAPRSAIGSAINLLSIGRLDPIKRFEFAMDVLKILVRKGYVARLTILAVGQNASYERTLRDHADSLGVADHTQLLVMAQPVGRDAIADRLRSADFYLQTSEYESFGLVVLEALACGTPVLATDVGGMGELIRDVGGGLALPPVPALFAGHVIHMSEEPREYAQEALDGVRGAARFGWDAIAARTLGVYSATVRDSVVQLIVVGARHRPNGPVVLLRAFARVDREKAAVLLEELSSRYASGDVEVHYGGYASGDAFFRAEPEWDQQFPDDGDRSFSGPDGRGV